MSYELEVKSFYNFILFNGGVIKIKFKMNIMS
jgi:hypothetical protein